MTVVERFLKLVSYPTASDEASETCPSTARQLALAQELVRQMQDMGIADAHVDKDGYVYGTIPANCEKDIPVYGLIAHMDTSPDAPGENIRARITEPYDGGDVILNAEKHIVLSPEEYPQLKNSVGKRLIVTDGTTLLGADDKAGVAEILSAAQLLLTSGKPHGTVKLHSRRSSLHASPMHACVSNTTRSSSGPVPWKNSSRLNRNSNRAKP